MTDAGSSGSEAGRGGAGDAGKSGQSGSSGSGQVAGSGGRAGSAGAAVGSGGNAASAGRGGTGPNAGAGGAVGTSGAKQYVYVSGYGSDIHLLELSEQGELKELTKVSGGKSPSYMAFSPDKRFAFAINEADAPDSKVLSFSIDAKSGQLSALNSQDSKGSGSPHLAVHPSGKWLAVAHYNSGEVTVLPIQENGNLGAASEPDRGPNNDCENAHQAVFDKSGDHLLVPCLGSNYVLQYKFENGALTYNDPPTVAAPGGPRHLALDPTETRAYVLSELDSILTWFDYDKATGKLTNPQSIDSFETAKGASAHIVVHSSGKWLYASNRKENSLGLFAIAGDGKPSPVAFETDMIEAPRDFSIDTTGQWLILANQDGAQTVLLYSIDQSDGKLTRTQTLTGFEKPTFTHALTLP